MANLERVAIDGQKPDLTIMLDLDPVVGLERAASRGEAADRYEKEKLALHEERRNAFLAIAKAEPDRCAVVDAGQSQSNGELFGHDDQEAFLIRTWASGRMHHALLFSGPQGIGKATLAFRFARHILANPVFDAGSMDDTASDALLRRQIAVGAHPQVLHLTRPFDPKTQKFKTQLTVEETRRISNFLSFTVPGNGWRIVIVDPVNDMNASAANALLKNLEEPTPRTLFILIAQSQGRILPTIRSRCLQLRFEPLNVASMHHAIESLHLEGNRDAASLVAYANGSPRRAAMLAEGGALEVISAADAVLASRKFEGAAALKIGDALTSREAEPLFFLLCEHLLQRLAQFSTGAALSGLTSANRLAALHSEVSNKLAITRGYNLDKRQFLLETMRELHDGVVESGARHA
ncbi:unnamed protein product [Darwinula stevensoni]|uniref:Thymidylate kinase-like domain-containing protein n=1 Tax=Darwinula stevensoni TaxID=69355 RepID=A0A7R9AIM3_9CRUS|nr:unnamed protein product [Darwinula stevensoni]CAG0905749.1 unnamed protein product [Darwinula stevensoni]